MPKKKEPEPPTKSETGRSVRVPIDVYENLLRLQGVYPGKTLSEIAGIKLRKAMEEDRALLAKLRDLEKEPPDHS